MAEILFKIWITGLVVALICCFISLFKTENAIKNQMIILNAIRDHDMKMIEQHRYDEMIGFEVMEDYDKTFNRFWDWGYTRIAPPEVFEKIKPYIER